MQRDPRAFLWDVCDAAEAIAEFTKQIDFETYAARTCCVRALNASWKSSVRH
jgi:uncharacterized protein with HEPN domain